MVLTRKNLDWWCGRGILFLVLGMLVFAPLAFGAVDAWAFLIVQGMAAGVFILWAARLWLNPKPKILWPPLASAVVAFMVYAVARYFSADIEYVARLELIQVLLFGFLFLAVVNNLSGAEETLAISFTLLAVATGIACYAAAQLVMHSNQVWNELSPYAGRASGTFISPNNLAGFLAMLLPLSLAFLLVGRLGMVAKILLGYAAVAMAVGLAVTFSRAGWIAAAAGILLLLGILLGHGNHRLRAGLLLAVMLAGGTFFVSHYLSKTTGYMERVQKTDADGPGVLSVDTRLQMWQVAGEMWRDHFWLGVGPAHFDYRFREYRPEVFQGRPDRAHNDYLNLLADWGTIGGVIVFAGIGIFIFSAFKTWPHVRREENDFGHSQSNRFAFFLGAVCGLAALAVHSLMDFNLHIPANALVGITLLALASSNLRFATEQNWFRAGAPVKIIFMLTLLGGAAYLVAQEISLAGETKWLARAERQGNFSPERAAALQKAFASEPKNFQTAYDIGECFRVQSLDGGENFRELAQTAMDWYAAARRLNPHDGYSFLRTGMCLDWLDRHADADKFYQEAEARDPNGYYMIANIGWHFVQTGDYVAARQYFLRSLALSNDNEIARRYWLLCEDKLQQESSGAPRFPRQVLSGIGN